MKREPPPCPCSTSHHLPGLIRMLRGIGADQVMEASPKWLVAQTGPHVRIDKVGATARMGNLTHVDQGGEFLILGVDHGDLVGLVGRGQEVTLGRIPAAVVQEGRGLDRRWS
jgi:hypothetical protein